MKERLEEAESMGVRRMKAQVQAMEGRVSSLEEQLDAATRSALSLSILATFICTLVSSDRGTFFYGVDSVSFCRCIHVGITS